MIDKYTGREIVSPADKLWRRPMKVMKEVDLLALQKAIFSMKASTAMAVLAAVGVEGSELKGLELEPTQIQEPQSVSPDHIPNSKARAEDVVGREFCGSPRKYP